MTQQRNFRMPATADEWRHYKGGLYTVIGMSRDDKGHAVVVYTDANWNLAQLAPIYNQRLSRFIQEVANGTPRFEYVGRMSGDFRCQYIDLSRRQPPGPPVPPVPPAHRVG